MCNNSARKALPPGWTGTCTLGVVLPDITVIKTLNPEKRWIRTFLKRTKKSRDAITDRPTKFHSFVRWFLSWLEVSELEKTIVNISAVTENIEDNVIDAVQTSQIEVSSLSQVTLQNIWPLICY